MCVKDKFYLVVWLDSHIIKLSIFYVKEYTNLYNKIILISIIKWIIKIKQIFFTVK